MKHRRIATIASVLALGLAAGGAAVAAQGATTAQTPDLPTITINIDGNALTVGGALQSGAVDIRTTTVKEAEPTLFRLDPGVTPDQVIAFLSSKQGQDPDNAATLGSIVFDANAPKGTSDVQTTLEAGTYLALDTQGNPAQGGHAFFTVAPAAQPAALPAPDATVRAIDFGFRGPKTLHAGSVVRFQNDGFLTHMIVGIRVKNAAAAKRVTRYLKAGKDKKANKAAIGGVALQGPVSHGGMQQQTLTTKPGTYVLACFMATQDGREHTRLGMLKTIRIAK
jgi:hypothetical protein